MVKDVVSENPCEVVKSVGEVGVLMRSTVV